MNLKVKLFCLESAGQKTNMEFDECYYRLQYLNFTYFDDIMKKKMKED